MDTPQLTSAPPGKDKVTDFIALLDQYLHLTGHTLAPGRNVQSSIASANSPQDSDQIYTPVPLPTHLEEQEHDLIAASTLEKRIRTIHTSNAPVVSAAHARLNTEYATCTPSPSPLALHTFKAKTSISDKLATLRTHQHHNPPEYHVPAFTITVVKALDNAGDATETSTIYLPKNSTNWISFHLACQRATTCSQTETAGFPTGYPLRAGPWLVQPTRHNVPTSSTPTHALKTKDDFATLRAWLRADKDMSVLIWHELLWKRSRELRQVAQRERNELREWASWALPEEVRDEHGQPFFEPGWGDDQNWEGVELQLELEAGVSAIDEVATQHQQEGLQEEEEEFSEGE